MSTEAVKSSGLRTLEDYQKSKKAESTGTNLGMDSFLKLFVAQLSSQDPLSGGGDGGSNGTDYISQLAQLTMLEQMSSLNNSLASNQAYNLIGKYVYLGNGGDPSKMPIGRVDGVVNDNGVSMLMIGGKAFELSDVYAVVDGSSGATDEELLKSADMIGKTVTANIKDSAGTESTVTGKVDKILVKEGIIYLVIGDKNIPLINITEIAEKADETAADAATV